MNKALLSTFLVFALFGLAYGNHTYAQVDYGSESPDNSTINNTTNTDTSGTNNSLLDPNSGTNMMNASDSSDTGTGDPGIPSTGNALDASYNTSVSDESSTPGIPSTGAGGYASSVLLLMILAATAAIAGASLLKANQQR